MVKRMSTGRWAAIANAAQKTWNPCEQLPKVVLNDEIVVGANTWGPLSSSGLVSDTIPLTYLQTTGSDQNFGLLHDSDTCRGQNKVLVYASASSPGFLARVSASLDHGNTHIFMMEGARVELTWAPQDPGSLVGSHWTTSLRHSSSYDGCPTDTGPKAWLD